MKTALSAANKDKVDDKKEFNSTKNLKISFSA